MNGMTGERKILRESVPKVCAHPLEKGEQRKKRAGSQRETKKGDIDVIPWRRATFLSSPPPVTFPPTEHFPPPWRWTKMTSTARFVERKLIKAERTAAFFPKGKHRSAVEKGKTSIYIYIVRAIHFRKSQQICTKFYSPNLTYVQILG